MKNSKSRKDQSSCVPGTYVAVTGVADACQCNYKYKEMNAFLSNLEVEEEKRRLSEFLQKLKLFLGPRGKMQIGHPFRHTPNNYVSPFESCPVLHYEEGIWKRLTCAFIKTRNPVDIAFVKRSKEEKQKVNVNSNLGVKKMTITKSGFTAPSLKNAGFRHNLPVEQVLQGYRDSNMYSKARMRRVDKVTIMNVFRSAINSRQVPTPAILIEPRIMIPREICTKIVNLSFNRESLQAHQRDSKVHRCTVTSNHKDPSAVVKSRVGDNDSLSFQMVIKQLFPGTV